MRFFRSLYLQLLGVYGLTFLLLIFAIGIGIRVTRPEGMHRFFRNNAQTYGELLARDIGSPPDTGRAQALHVRTGLEIAVIGPKLEWSSGPEVLERARGLAPEQGTWVRRRERIIRVDQDGYTFFFTGPGFVSEESNVVPFALAMLAVALILWFSYRLTRRVFRPLDQMKASALAFGEGRWDARVPVTGQDELAELASTMNSMAERIQRQFASMRELLIAISHELRSPLTRMRVVLEFLPDPKLKGSLAEEITLLDRMTEALLERERVTSRPDLLEKVPVDLGALIRELVLPYKDRTPGLVVDIGEQLQTAVDRNRFAIALRNLIENAYKHGTDASRGPEISAHREGAEIRITVRDHGPGMSDEEISRLGEPFFRAEASRTGSRALGGFGLGLSLAYSIFRAHGARVDARRADGGGTIFIIALPAG